MDYNNIIKNCEESSYLISMTPLQKIVETGYYLELNNQSKVLDLCCGYGEMLKIWCEAFGISGKGVDICKEFINKGNERIAQNGLNNKISLVVENVKEYHDNEKYDVACLIGEDLFGGLKGTIRVLESFIKEDGKMIIGIPYLHQKETPKELIEFEGELHTLEEIYDISRESGCLITHIAGCTQNEWERYITWSARRDLQWLKDNPNHIDYEKKQAWIDYWYKMYFNYRKDYEGWALFVLERV
ncbi:SAM-dependent methyltransferase [Oceanirhabdus seepicola]|uniref:Class I SAM-dependent methyltransferase n=1 Tax=Oceanirhabdus seepicola TaxID=2828781 RepID=A0A9J6NYL8_9CLOT|nr:class I SAM-dependent methyltransferase [Oceanirhabdus seepicola]MCM1989070.1 class I SAM-dependent methyltransferase [Oceanirhabdus seepicola]